MKSTCMLSLVSLVLALGFWARAEVVTVALSDFTVTAGQDAAKGTVGGLSAESLAQQGAFALGKSLLKQGDYEVVDRREMLQKLQGDQAEPSLLRAAQQLNADVLMEGSVQSFSTRSQSVNQGGYQADFQELQMRIGLEARDTVSGRVIAMASGSANQPIRQTGNVQTQYGEDDILNLQQNAIDQALPELLEGIEAYRDKLESRQKIMLSISTDKDPALVEIDGLLIGSTPMQNVPVYAGDHVITVGKAGYRDVIKKIKLDQDVNIEVPLFRTELSAEETKEVLEKARLNAYWGIDSPILIETIERTE